MSKSPNNAEQALKQQNFEKELANFLEDWRSDEKTLWVKTSGSTGNPKPMEVEKDRMRASARMTCDFLGLQSGDSALLCMPLAYIAGKMVVVRAEERGLQLIPVAPCGHPLATLSQAPTFAALIPLQVYNSLQVSEEKALLKQVKHLIIGGGAIDAQMAQELKDFPNAVWSTYGMTETLSHIALRRLNGPEASDWYTPLSGVEVSLSEEHTLVIKAPHLCPETLTTNDVVEIAANGTFRVRGRRDNVVNSGGIKIQIEEVEARLKEVLDLPFQITAQPDAKFGEILVLLYEGAKTTGEKLASENSLEEKPSEEKLAGNKLEIEKLTRESSLEEKLEEEKLAGNKLEIEKLTRENSLEEKPSEEKLAGNKLEIEKLTRESSLEEKLEDEEEEAAVERICKAHLPQYWIPKKYKKISALPVTETGKPDRATARRLAEKD